MKTIHWLIIYLLFCCFYYLFYLQLYAAWFFSIDDLFIPLRYAKNWVAGHGLVWNIGEPPVEGYSNFSFMLLATLAIYFKYDPVTLLKFSSVTGLFFTVWALFLLSRLWFSRWLASIPCLWLLVYRGEIFWAVSGMETTVYQSLLCLGLFFLLRGIGYNFAPLARNKINCWFMLAASFIFFGASITRPEAPLLIIIFYLLALFNIFKDQTFFALVMSALAYIAFFLPYFLWRWYYYGLLFPSAIYCKGFNNFYDFNLDTVYLRLAWPLLVLAIFAGRKSRTNKLHFFFWLPSVIYLILLIGSDPVSAFMNRLFLPAYGLLLPLALAGVMNLLNILFKSGQRLMQLKAQVGANYFGPLIFSAQQRSLWGLGCRQHQSCEHPDAQRFLIQVPQGSFKSHERIHIGPINIAYDWSYYLCLVITVLVITLFFIPSMSLSDYRSFTLNPQKGLELRTKVATWLIKNVAPGSQVVLGDAGVIPYLSDLNFIDSYCLNNKKMLYYGKKHRFIDFCHEIFAIKPELIILTFFKSGGQTIYTPADACLAAQLLQQNIYKLRKKFKVTSKTNSNIMEEYNYEIYSR